MIDIPTQPINYPPATWRLIIHPPAGGAWNMAVDETLSESVAHGESPPVLRFYAWQPGCLSLGYAQPAADVQFERLQAHGWDAVRRLTGGRAILHIDELTYSIAAPLEDSRIAGGVIESYRQLSKGLLAGLTYLGVEVSAGRVDEDAHRFSGPVCFEVPSDYEITVQGKKLVGSAQTRRIGVVLQHGALPLFGDVTRICDALSFASPAEQDQSRARLRSRALTLEQAFGRPVEPQKVIEALARGFENALNLTFQPAGLTDAETERAEELRASKYATSEWINRH